MKNIIKKWILLPLGVEFEDISDELRNNIMEFINAQIEHNETMDEKSPVFVGHR